MSNTDLIAAAESAAAMHASLDPQSVLSLVASLISFVTALLGATKVLLERKQAAPPKPLALPERRKPSSARKPARKSAKKPARKQPAKKSGR